MGVHSLVLGNADKVGNTAKNFLLEEKVKREELTAEAAECVNKFMSTVVKRLTDFIKQKDAEDKVRKILSGVGVVVSV